MIRAVLILLAFTLPAAAQEAPTIDVALDPAGPVSVGAPVTVAITVLVPTFMPQPPTWPDLQIADAITRLPERATTPVTRRVGSAIWSGLTRSYQIVPQRAADYAITDAVVALTWAGADNRPQQATLPVPDIAFSAIVPPGAEGLDPFLAASVLTVTATAVGLPEAPKPGDALTLTLTATASGPPAMLLPPLIERIATPEGLRAYPTEPVLTDTPGERGAPPTASRVESVTYVIEAPGSYALPAVSVSWWDTDAASVVTATTDPIIFDVPAPAGWTTTPRDARSARQAVWIAASLTFVVAGGLLWRHASAARGPRPLSERRLYSALRRKARTGHAGSLRASVLDWMRRASPNDPRLPPEIEAALRAVERSAYGRAGSPVPTSISGGADQDAKVARRALLTALAARRTALHARSRSLQPGPQLPPLNPTLATQIIMKAR